MLSIKYPCPAHPSEGQKTGKPILSLADLLGRIWAKGVISRRTVAPLTFRNLSAARDDVSPTAMKELHQVGFVEHGGNHYGVMPRVKVSLRKYNLWTRFGSLRQRFSPQWLCWISLNKSS